MNHATFAERPAEAPVGMPSESGVSAATRRDAVRKGLLACGVASSVLYIGAEVYAWTRYPGYSPVSQVFSELLAEGSPTRPFLVLISGAPYNLLVAALAVGVWLSSAGVRRLARITAVLLAMYAVFSFLGGTVFQMDVRGTEGTARGALHPAVTGVMVLFMLLSLGFGAFLHGLRFRVYTLGTLLTILVFAGLTFLAAPSIAANEPTPWLGLLERVNIYAWMLWVAVLAVSLWPRTFCSAPARVIGYGQAMAEATRTAPDVTRRAAVFVAARLPRVDGVAARAHSQSAPGDADARESRRNHADPDAGGPAPSSADHVDSRLGDGTVARGCRDRRHITSSTQKWTSDS
jgi:hypothetical protein